LQVSLICITSRPESSMARAADIHLCVKVPKEACPLGLAPTSSTTAALVMGDALAVALLEITRKNLGMTAICDDEMNIIGIFTDGDLRRVFDTGIDMRNASIAEVMTR
ncbi:SIS domain-containing protein, partial [Klebsiella pneumoniae]|uniref:SIS domain-containing protein n=1 Tax=Klebsiella pneumoniae TaxID=573 RepID=UPI000E349822